MNSIVHEEARPTKGTAEEVSTVGIELLRHRLGDIRVELYDCGGQIDYAGMRQIFLSRRALYLLVWDVKKCHGKHGDDLDRVGGVKAFLFIPRSRSMARYWRILIFRVSSVEVINISVRKKRLMRYKRKCSPMSNPMAEVYHSN